MNELSHQLKSLAYSLTVVPVSDRCIESVAAKHELRPLLERLKKGVAKHRSSGYDLETKKAPIESSLLAILDRLKTQDLKIADIQKQCSLLTTLEKSTLLDLLEKVLAKMELRAKAAQQIMEALAAKGLNIDDLR